MSGSSAEPAGEGDAALGREVRDLADMVGRRHLEDRKGVELRHVATRNAAARIEELELATPGRRPVAGEAEHVGELAVLVRSVVGMDGEKVAGRIARRLHVAEVCG